MKSKSAAVRANLTDQPPYPDAFQRTARPHKAENCAFQNILVPIDFSSSSLHAFDTAARLAGFTRGKLILLHVVEPVAYPGTYLGNGGAVDESQNNNIEVAREKLLDLARKHALSGTVPEVIVRLGRPPLEIPDTARALGADLIVIAARGHEGSQQSLLGSTAERVVSHAHCPVLTTPWVA